MIHCIGHTSLLPCLSSVQFSRSVMSDSLRPHESQHARPPCPSPTPEVHSDSRPSSRCCHPAISSSVVPFSSCPQSLPASESFPMSQLCMRWPKIILIQTPSRACLHPTESPQTDPLNSSLISRPFISSFLNTNLTVFFPCLIYFQDSAGPAGYKACKWVHWVQKTWPQPLPAPLSPLFLWASGPSTHHTLHFSKAACLCCLRALAHIAPSVYN